MSLPEIVSDPAGSEQLKLSEISTFISIRFLLLLQGKWPQGKLQKRKIVENQKLE